MFYEMFQKENYVIRVQTGYYILFISFFTLGAEVNKAKAPEYPWISTIKK